MSTELDIITIKLQDEVVDPSLPNEFVLSPKVKTKAKPRAKATPKDVDGVEPKPKAKAKARAKVVSKDIDDTEPKPRTRSKVKLLSVDQMTVDLDTSQVTSQEPLALDMEQTTEKKARVKSKPRAKKLVVQPTSSLNDDGSYTRLPNNDDPLRDIYVNLFETKGPMTNIQARRLESAFFNQAMLNYIKATGHSSPGWGVYVFRTLYNSLCDRVWCLLTESSWGDRTLLDKYIATNTGSDEIVNMTDRSINKEKWAIIDKEYLLKEQSSVKVYRPTTTLYRCRYCHTSKAFYDEVQTRCADEPATIFLECVNCNKAWRIG